MFRRRMSEKRTYDKEKLQPVLKCSICNGEQVAGFKNRQTGKFEEVMFIRDTRDLAEFLEMYELSSVEKEY